MKYIWNAVKIGATITIVAILLIMATEHAFTNSSLLAPQLKSLSFLNLA